MKRYLVLSQQCSLHVEQSRDTCPDLCLQDTNRRCSYSLADKTGTDRLSEHKLNIKVKPLANLLSRKLCSLIQQHHSLHLSSFYCRGDETHPSLHQS